MHARTPLEVSLVWDRGGSLRRRAEAGALPALALPSPGTPAPAARRPALRRHLICIYRLQARFVRAMLRARGLGAVWAPGGGGGWGGGEAEGGGWGGEEEEGGGGRSRVEL